MKKQIKQKLSLDKFRVAKLVNSKEIKGGYGTTDGIGDGDTVLGDSTRYCNLTTTG